MKWCSTPVENNTIAIFPLSLTLSLSLALHLCPVPCVPTNPKGRLDCVTNSAWVSWDNSAGALNYMAFAEAVNGDYDSNCTTLASDPSCNIPNLRCGTEYIFYVVAANDQCLSSNSSNFTLETGTHRIHWVW